MTGTSGCWEGRDALRDNQRALSLLAARWAGEVSLDFIAGIPGQTASGLRSDLSALDEARARHASLYSLTVEPGTGLAAAAEEGRISLNDPERDEDLWFAGRDELERRGFGNYEISNFCLPGSASVHNLRYWNLEPYLGVGPGAVSTLPSAMLARILPRLGLHGPSAAEVVCRLTCPHSIDGFLAGPEGLWGIRAEPIAAGEFLLETLMMGLRLAEGIPADRLEHRFGRSFEELFPGLWTRWVEQGLALPVDGRLRLSGQGRLVLDALLAQIAARISNLPGPPADGELAIAGRSRPARGRLRGRACEPVLDAGTGPVVSYGLQIHAKSRGEKRACPAIANGIQSNTRRGPRTPSAARCSPS